MRLIAIQPTGGPPAPSDYLDAVQATYRGTRPGVPINIANVAKAVKDRGIGQSESPAPRPEWLALQALRADVHGGRLLQCAAGMFAYPDARGELPAVEVEDLVTGMLVAGVPTEVQVLCDSIQLACDASATGHRVRNALHKLLRQGKVERVKPEVYQRV